MSEGKQRPLNARCALALGCSVVYATHADGTVAAFCGCAHPTHAGVAGANGVWLLPYGEDSPAGWACTGPLIERFGLTVGPGNEERTFWVARDWGQDDDTFATGATAGDAIAKWAAEFGVGGEVRRG